MNVSVSKNIDKDILGRKIGEAAGTTVNVGKKLVIIMLIDLLV
jgi:hypothetical protein